MRYPTHTALIAGLMAIPAAAGAQADTVDRRVDRLEGEMRAVQRVVFPGGAGKYVTPQITPPDTATVAPGTPASTPLADLETRVTALERQQATLTGQIEQAQFRLRKLEDDFAAYKRTADARLMAPGDGSGAASTATVGATEVDLARPAATRPSIAAATRPAPTPAATAKPAADSDRATRVAAIERPVSGDPAEDSYLYGYRLWEAKYYPEAEAALKDTVAKYPKHRRASFSQNLLGRAYLDEGRPSLASMAFYDSFKKYPDGERAPDSLYYLGQSLMKLGKPADACKVYAELDASYGAKMTPELKARAAKGRADAKCQ